MPASVAELSWIETADGQIYYFNDSEERKALTAVINGGLPDQRFFTRLPYRADREIEIDDPRLNPRDWNILIYNKQLCRDDFWTARSDLLDAVRPNRGGQPLFVFEFPDGRQRAIYVRPQSPTFDRDDADEWQEFSFQEMMQFRAFDPTWFDPTQATTDITQEIVDELVFPITFDSENIVFDNVGFYGSLTVTYQGNWYSYPTFVVDGPCDSVTFNHIELGLTINYNQPILTGEQVTINLDKRLYQDQAGNHIVLHPISNIVDFRIEPDPVITDGINTIEVFLPGNDANSNVNIAYYTRYIGI